MKKIIAFAIAGWCLLSACSKVAPKADKEVDSYPDIFPDYTEVTVPTHIAPLNFGLVDKTITDAWALLSAEGESYGVKMKKGTFHIPSSDWRNLLEKAVGKSIQVAVTVQKGKEVVGYKPFEIYVSADPMDGYIAYRRIAPGYELWKNLGIYQRDLSSYKEMAVLENRQTGDNCMNCHSFCNRQPDHFLFHMRQKFGGTYLVNGKQVEKLDTKTDQTISNFVYPSWHPGGRYVAFSVNNTKQFFHPVDKNRVEVYDDASDVIVYDTEKHEALTTNAIFSKQRFETFPTFSADGKTLYYCSAEAKTMPESFKEVKYSLCAISFDPESRTFGNVVDTLFSATKENKSVSFPRVSPDGKFLMFTVSSYGNFSIWHKDADLYVYDMQKEIYHGLNNANSDDVESYHSWSSNGRWFVFSSRRIDGLYTSPYFAHIAEDGTVSKPFLLPQAESSFYEDFMQSYNIPEFVSGKIEISPRSLVNAAEGPSVGVKMAR